MIEQQMNTSIYCIGLMSGTSMDGTDAVCIGLSGKEFERVYGHIYLPFDAPLKAALLAMQEVGWNELHRSRMLAQTLSKHYAQAVFALRSLPEVASLPIFAIGCHGQTIRHQPEKGYSIQLADFALLAEQTQLPVVGDFRAADIAAGGQGAPLVPAFHQAVFADRQKTRVIVNIGGIANITILSPKRAVLGFDTGPGNMLMDAWMRKNFCQEYDYDGQIAHSGSLNQHLLTQLMSEPYFHLPAPKSTGRDIFSLSWLEKRLHELLPAEDVLRTLCECTALSITQAVQEYAPTAQVYLCGGGAKNTFLRTRLAALLPNASVDDTAALGLPVDEVEAVAFAWLAGCYRQNIASNIPHITGATGVRLLGTLWQPFACI